MNNQITCCSKCILTNLDYPEIVFDENGICNICHTYDELAKRTVFIDKEGQNKLTILLNNIKKEGINKEYDCILGISGGVDSTYLAYLSKQWGIKPLIIHVDNGWNTELALSNINQTLKLLNYDLYTQVIDWETMREYQMAFIKANVVDIDLPCDNTIMALLFKMAIKYKIKYILSGENTTTEGYLPPNFVHNKLDSQNIKDIYKKFRTKKVKPLQTIGFLKYHYYTKIKGIELCTPLNYIPYTKEQAKTTIIKELGWRDYGAKHYENIFTRFYQGYILPQKFSIDKRKSHLSTLICSGQITRDIALQKIQEDTYPNKQLLDADKEFFMKKFNITLEFFNTYISTPQVSHLKYKSYLNSLNYLRKIKNFFK